MSWDKNNLACICVFPPWQRKGLGSLLIGVSYEISRRERILGGPEKPISDVGKKGYIKYWAGEISRYLLQLELEDGKQHSTTVAEISKATWISREDTLEALRYMGLANESGDGGRGVVIDKEDIRAWVERMHLNLVPAIDPAGFPDGLYVRPPTPDMEDDDVE